MRLTVRRTGRWSPDGGRDDRADGVRQRWLHRRRRPRRTRPSSAGKGDCGDFNIAVNPWVGYEADAYVVGNVAETSSAARSATRSSRRTSRGRASAPATSTWSSRTGVTPTWRRSTSPSTGDGSAEDLGPDRQRRHHPLVRAAVAGQGAPRRPRLQEPEQVRRQVQDLGVRWQGFVPGRRPVVRPVRRGDHQQPEAELQGDLLRFGGRQHRGVREGGEEQGVADRLLLRAAVALRRVPAQGRQAPAVHGRLPGRPGEGRLRLPRDHAEEGRLDGLGQEGLDGRRPGQEVQVDQRRPERRGASTSPRTRCRSEDAAAKWVKDNPDKVKAWLG